MTNKMFLMGLGVALLSSASAYSACTTMPTCASLGYDKISCPNDDKVLKCPFDTSKMACIGTGTSDEDTGEDTSICKVGDIYYSDNTCSATKINGKTAIGVVFDTANRLVLALNNAPNKLPWNDGSDSLEYVFGYRYLSHDDILGDMDGKGNTDKIMAFAQSSGVEYKAAKYCAELTTGGKTWFLPSTGQLMLIQPNVKDLNAILVTVGGSGFKNYLDKCWSSTEFDRSRTVIIEPSEEEGSYLALNDFNTKNYSHYVRCVFQY